MINLRELPEQQKNQRALKIKIKILEQTHDIKLAESSSPITKKLDETTQKLGDVNKELQPKTPKVAIGNTHNALLLENEQIQPGIIIDTSLENTLDNMKKFVGLFNIEESDNGDVFWNGIPVERMGGNKFKINEKIYDITPGIRKVFTDKTNTPTKQLNDKDRENLTNILESIHFENHKAIRGESKSGRYKQSRNIFKKRNLEGQGVKIIIP